MNVRHCDKNSGRKKLKEVRLREVRRCSRSPEKAATVSTTNSVFLHHSINPSFHYSTIPLFHHSNIPPFHYSKIPLFQYSPIPTSCEGTIELMSPIAESEFTPERVSEFPVLPKNVQRQSLPYSLSPPLLQLDGNMNLRRLLRQTRREYLFVSSRVELSNILFRPCRGCP